MLSVFLTICATVVYRRYTFLKKCTVLEINVQVHLFLPAFVHLCLNKAVNDVDGIKALSAYKISMPLFYNYYLLLQ